MALPEPVERYLAHALPAGPPPGPAARMRMAGRIKLGAWLPFTAEEQCDGRSFVWRARVGPLRVTDRFAGGAGATEGRLFDRRTVFGALLPARGVRWRAESDELIVATWAVPPERPEVRLRIGPDGAPRAVSALRWGQRGTEVLRVHPLRMRG